MSKTISLRESTWEWLQFWMPDGPASGQVDALVQRGIVFWPAGPQSCFATTDGKRRELWEQLADELGLEGEPRERFLARTRPMRGGR